jgi:type IV pilus assembly protein PilM
MAIANGATCYFTRVLGGGLEAMAVEIAERREISLELARNLLSDTGVDPQAIGNDAPTLKLAPAADEPEPQHPALSLSRPTQPEDWGVEVDAEEETAILESSNLPDVIQPEVAQAATGEQADVRMVLENGAREIAGEVRNSLDFYRAQDRTAEVNSVVLSGPALGIEGFAEALQNHLGLPVTCETVRSLEHSHPDVSLDHLAIAAGLAAEEIHI